MKKVTIEKKGYILDDFFKVEEAYLRFEKFNGEMSGQVRRLSMERGDAAAVLVYNLDTNKLILISQFRYPTYNNGDGWTTEVIAGMIDPGEKPDEAARREVKEETGLSISTFEHIADFYLSPGGSSERIFLYYSEVSGDGAKHNKFGGLKNHNEDIMSFEISLDDAIEQVKTGEILDAKTVLGIYWLENRSLKKNKST